MQALEATNKLNIIELEFLSLKNKFESIQKKSIE